MRPRLNDQDIETLLSALKLYANYLEEEEKEIQLTKPFPTLTEEWVAYIKKLSANHKVSERVRRLRIQLRRIQLGKQKGRLPTFVNPYHFERIAEQLDLK